jgi:hypothetical protein
MFENGENMLCSSIAATGKEDRGTWDESMVILGDSGVFVWQQGPFD